MRKIIIAGLAILTTLGVVLAIVLGTPASPVKATTTVSTDASDRASTLLLGLGGVSCLSAKFCAAAGSQGDSAHLARGDVPLTMIWNGAHWRKTATPLPKGWSEGSLTSVSCPSAGYCVAYGSVVKGSNWAPLAETWRGRAWKASTLPKPTTAAVGAANFGGMVSCPAVGHCVALVGYRGIETLTGSKWTLRAVPLPKGYTAGSVAGVSCVSATSCVIAGGYDVKGWSLLFESWNGSRFTPMTLSSEPAARFFAIDSVSCTSTKSCVAMGTISGATPVLSVTPFAERWNGKAWSMIGVTAPREPKNAAPDAVSCASATRCLAVGQTVVSGTAQLPHAVALAYDGRSWLTTSVPALPHGDASAFSGVSCPSTTYCVAVGQGGGAGGSLYSNAALTGFWNGKRWKLVSAS